MEWFYAGPQKGWNWLPMICGEYQGRTLPYVFFDNPEQIHRIVENELIEIDGKYSKELARQAKLIYELSAHIYPANAPRDKFEFLALVDRKGVLARVITVMKGDLVPDKWRGKYFLVKRCPVLDAKIYREYENPDLGCRRLAASLRMTLFPYCPRPRSTDLERFMITFSNFGGRHGQVRRKADLSA